MRNGMARDFSWERSVTVYLDVYRRALARSRNGRVTRAHMDFVLTLHSHLPYVLNHGRWPHGSDWLCEAASTPTCRSSRSCSGLAAEPVAGPGDDRLHAGAGQPARQPDVRDARWRPSSASASRPAPRRRRRSPQTGERAPAAAGGVLARAPAAAPAPLPRGRRRSHRAPSARSKPPAGSRSSARPPPTAFCRSSRATRASGCSSPSARPSTAACSGGCPAAAGCPSAPTGRAVRGRPGPPHPAAGCAGASRSTSPTPASASSSWTRTSPRRAARSACPVIRRRSIPRCTSRSAGRSLEPAQRTPYQAYRVAHTRGTGDSSAYVRDPRASMQVWSRFEGYPGDGAYLEFHKMRWPGGLKLWRVSGPERGPRRQGGLRSGAGARPRSRSRGSFRRAAARDRSAEGQRRDGVIVAPFDTELFGHWWFEGPDFLGDVYRALRGRVRGPARRPAPDIWPTHPTRAAIRLPAGSWGANGDFSMWLSDRPRGPGSGSGRWRSGSGTWLRRAHVRQATRPILAQATRELLLAQSSDWQFIISTGAAADYGERRFREHCSDTEELDRARWRRLRRRRSTAAHRRAAELAERDALFPDVLPAVAAALGGSRSLALG